MAWQTKAEGYGYDQPDEEKRPPAFVYEERSQSRQSALQFGLEPQHQPPWHHGTFDLSVTIPAALPSNTDTYGYDQSTDVSVTPPVHEDWYQEQQRPRLELEYRLPGQGQNDRLASTSAAAFPEVSQEKNGLESPKLDAGTYSPPPSYDEVTYAGQIPARNNYERGRVSSPYLAPVSSQYITPTSRTVSTTNLVITQPVGNQPQIIRPNEIPRSYMPLSIFACLCCIWPIGLLAIRFSCMTETANDAADYVTARRYSRRALCTAITSIAIGIPVIVIYVVFKVVQMQQEISTRTTTTPGF